MARIIPALTLDGLAAAPWALERAVLADLVKYAQRAERQTAAAPVPPGGSARNAGSIAVIPIHGMLERRSSFFLELLGGTSVEDIRGALRAAVASPQVQAIVLDVDSPGGGVSGITELAAEIRSARNQKRIVAVADSTAASAAYWLGSQADQFLVAPSGMVGSIGIYAVHFDISRALDNEGVTPTIISAGEHKVDGNEFEPLSDHARDAMQARADEFYRQFVGDVAKGRGVPVATVESDYGQGGVLLARDALAAGMVDGIGTMDDAIRLAQRPLSGQRAETGEQNPAEVDLPFRARIERAVEELAHLAEHANVRAALRAREGRPLFSESTEAGLRSIRDGLDALLTPDEPEEAAATAEQPVEPAAGPSTPAPVPAEPRFRSPADWDRYLQEIAH